MELSPCRLPFLFTQLFSSSSFSSSSSLTSSGWTTFLWGHKSLLMSSLVICQSNPSKCQKIISKVLSQISRERSYKSRYQIILCIFFNGSAPFHTKCIQLFFVESTSDEIKSTQQNTPFLHSCCCCCCSSGKRRITNPPPSGGGWLNDYDDEDISACVTQL